ncbi:MAG: nucleoside-diphosphate kinase, partial [Kiritimatiellae bacterium]|nr:nucleoside-diphosphate kinase [Kiritimatiellia bacterium]
MAIELAFVLINPYTIAKSRTGGVIARVIARTDLELVGARMFGPSVELAQEYAGIIRNADQKDISTCGLIADYILENYSPDKETGASHRVMMLLFQGEDAIRKIWNVTGSATLSRGSGETVRDTYGDYVLNTDRKVQYFEPAILVAPTKKRAGITLRLWSSHSGRDGGIIGNAGDVPRAENSEKTLVMLKPDSFHSQRAKAGNIIDMLSLSGLRIVAVRKLSMTVAQAEEFYGPVQAALKNKFKDIGARRAAEALSREFGFE